MAGGFVDNHSIFMASTTTAGAAGTSTITSSAVDCAGYDGCLFIVPIGAIVSGAATSIKAQQCDTSGGSYADLTGTSQTIADTADDTVVYIDVFRPVEQYLKVVVSRATQNATIGGIIAVRYNAANRPATQGASVSGEAFNWPAEGTA